MSGGAGLRLYQIQYDAWSGAGGRWVQPPGWRPERDEQEVGARWERDGLSCHLRGPWADVRRALVREGVWAA